MRVELAFYNLLNDDFLSLSDKAKLFYFYAVSATHVVRHNTVFVSSTIAKVLGIEDLRAVVEELEGLGFLEIAVDNDDYTNIALTIKR